jgi:hypothetical protein
MSGSRQKDLGDRLTAAESARKAMLERFRAKPGADDPAVAERKASRAAVSAARETRLAEREAEKRARLENEAIERAAREAAEKAETEREAAERVEREATQEAEQKAARDARYAARKARK